MKIYQPHLPFNGKGANTERTAIISWEGTRGGWFYIESANCAYKCLYADESGAYYFGAKELERVVPVVWNLKPEAMRVARKMRGRVKKYPFLLKSP